MVEGLGNIVAGISARGDNRAVVPAPVPPFHVGEFLKRLRKSLGYRSGAVVADRAGVNRNTISDIESGKTRDPGMLTFERIVNAIGCSMVDFYQYREKLLIGGQSDLPRHTDRGKYSDTNTGNPLGPESHTHDAPNPRALAEYERHAQPLQRVLGKTARVPGLRKAARPAPSPQKSAKAPKKKTGHGGGTGGVRS